MLNNHTGLGLIEDYDVLEHSNNLLPGEIKYFFHKGCSDGLGAKKTLKIHKKSDCYIQAKCFKCNSYKKINTQVAQKKYTDDNYVQHLVPANSDVNAILLLVKMFGPERTDKYMHICKYLPGTNRIYIPNEHDRHVYMCIPYEGGYGVSIHGHWGKRLAVYSHNNDIVREKYRVYITTSIYTYMKHCAVPFYRGIIYISPDLTYEEETKIIAEMLNISIKSLAQQNISALLDFDLNLKHTRLWDIIERVT